MPSLSGPNPMSLGEFGNYANAGGVNQAAQGATGLAGAIIGDPAARMRAQYLGAEAGRAAGQSQVIQKTLRDTAEIQSLLSQPGAITDGPTLQRVGALMATNPDLAAKFGSTLSTMMAANHSTGGPVTTQQTDAFAGSSGAVPYGQTPTGYGAGLRTQLGVAGIGAAASRYGSDQQLAGTKYTADSNSRTTLLTHPQIVTDAKGDNPTYVAPADAPGKPAFDSPTYVQGHGVTPTIPGSHAPPTLTFNKDLAGKQPVLTSDQSLGAVIGGAGRADGAPPIDEKRVLAGRPENVSEAALSHTLSIPTQQPPAQAEGIENKDKNDAALLKELTQQFVTPEMRAGIFPPPLNGAISGNSTSGTVNVDPDVRNAILERQTAYMRGQVPGAPPQLRANADDALRQAVLDLKPQLQFNHGNNLKPSALGGVGASVSFKKGQPGQPSGGDSYGTDGSGQPLPGGPAPSPAPSPLAATVAGGGAPTPGAAPPPAPGAPSASPLAQALSAQAATTQAPTAPQPPQAPAPPAAGPQAPQAAPPQPRPGPSNQAAAVIAQARSAVARATSPQQIAAIRQRLMQMNINPAAAGL